MDVFFYGLFMDVKVLKKNGIEPSNLRKGFLRDYTLKIGNRASLIPNQGEQAYGIVMSIDKEALDKLYAEASVADYIPEEVNIIIGSGKSIKAVCYNLPPEAMSGTNSSYANALYKLAKQIGFPEEYLEKIRSMAS